MFVLCVVSKARKAKCRTVKKQVRMKYKQNTRESKRNPGGGEIFRSVQIGPGPTRLPIQQIPGHFLG